MPIIYISTRPLDGIKNKLEKVLNFNCFKKRCKAYLVQCRYSINKSIFISKNEIKIINYNAIYREIGTEKNGHVVLGEVENF